MYAFMEYNSTCTDIILTLKGRQLQRQSEQHQVQQEAVHIQHRAHLKSPHRLNVRVHHQGQAHQRRASRHLPHQGAIHSLILRQRQSRRHQRHRRHRQQRQARLQKVLRQRHRPQSRTRPPKQAVQRPLQKPSQTRLQAKQNVIRLNFLRRL